MDRLAHGHDRSLVRLQRALADEPRRVVDLFVTMFGRQIDHRGETLGLATGETLAHLNHLRHRGEVTAHLGADGATRYRATAGAGRGMAADAAEAGA